ncbi:unnamed protein product [Rangifer tarandus platyrhynchus]|uniref:Uncharacterized protein n=1 Tax=Rangifer tarandus platyrhynchus TaxID=3082113 RepID=A0AC59YPL1_RANTA
MTSPLLCWPSLNYSAYIQPVCLPGEDLEVKAGTLCWATGWGRTLQFEPSQSPTLQETEQLILHYTKCSRMVKKQTNPFPKVVGKGMICGYHEKSGGPCKGDTGGPLVCQFNDKWIQIGIVSWGVHCALEEVSVIYTDVRFYKDWVYRTMNQASILGSGGFFIPLVHLVLALSTLIALPPFPSPVVFSKREDPTWEAAVTAPAGGEVPSPGKSTASVCSPLLSQGACGHRILGIIGGKPAPERKWPWQVSLQFNDRHRCRGSLIAPQWVLTAAHCVEHTKEYSVLLGTSKLMPPNATRTILIPVRDIIMHPKYWGRTFIMGDVALLQLHSPVIISKYVQPICLPEPNYSLKVGTQCWVTGWGQVKQRFSANSTLAPELQEAEVFIMDNKKCDQIYRKKSRIPRIVPLVLGDMICATNYREDLCSGDSGGPLACEVEGRWILAGVLSWEKACAKVHNPGVYTRITKYSRWIKKQISNGILSVPCTSAWLLLLFWLLQPQMGP